MTEKFSIVPLYNSSWYEYSATIQNVSLNFMFYYNSREQHFMFDIYDSNKKPIYLGIKLVPNFPLMDKGNLAPWGLNGFFYLQSLSFNANVDVTTITDITQYYKLLYFYEE